MENSGTQFRVRGPYATLHRRPGTTIHHFNNTNVSCSLNLSDLVPDHSRLYRSSRYNDSIMENENEIISSKGKVSSKRDYNDSMIEDETERTSVKRKITSNTTNQSQSVSKDVHENQESNQIRNNESIKIYDSQLSKQQNDVEISNVEEDQISPNMTNDLSATIHKRDLKRSSQILENFQDNVPTNLSSSLSPLSSLRKQPRQLPLDTQLSATTGGISNRFVRISDYDGLSSSKSNIFDSSLSKRQHQHTRSAPSMSLDSLQDEQLMEGTTQHHSSTRRGERREKENILPSERNRMKNQLVSNFESMQKDTELKKHTERDQHNRRKDSTDQQVSRKNGRDQIIQHRGELFESSAREKRERHNSSEVITNVTEVNPKDISELHHWEESFTETKESFLTTHKSELDSDTKDWVQHNTGKPNKRNENEINEGDRLIKPINQTVEEDGYISQNDNGSVSAVKGNSHHEEEENSDDQILKTMLRKNCVEMEMVVQRLGSSIQNRLSSLRELNQYIIPPDISQTSSYSTSAETHEDHISDVISSSSSQLASDDQDSTESFLSEESETQDYQDHAQRATYKSDRNTHNAKISEREELHSKTSESQYTVAPSSNQRKESFAPSRNWTTYNTLAETNPNTFEKAELHRDSKAIDESRYTAVASRVNQQQETFTPSRNWTTNEVKNSSANTQKILIDKSTSPDHNNYEVPGHLFVSNRYYEPLGLKSAYLLNENTNQSTTLRTDSSKDLLSNTYLFHKSKDSDMLSRYRSAIEAIDKSLLWDDCC
jgi:hypothetical protein